MNPARRIWLLALPVILLVGGLMVWGLWPEPNQVFHGKRESEWIDQACYSVNMPLPDEFVGQWRNFGPEGVEVLLRGLNRELGKANNPWIRLYRRIHGRVAAHVPFISNPAFDSRVVVRHTILLLLHILDADLGLATPPVARAMRDDDPHVRSMAMGFFITPVKERDWEVRLNRMDPGQKQKLLGEFIQGVQAPQPVRSTAAIALGFYPEAAHLVVPPLVNCLRDLDPAVRVFSARTLNRVDPAAAQKQGALKIILNTLDGTYRDEVSSLWALREFETEADVIIPALLDALETRDHIMSDIIIRTIEHFGKDRPDLVIPALQKAAQREDEAGRKAAAALERLEADVGSTSIEQL
jgi:hypothetical protein